VDGGLAVHEVVLGGCPSAADVRGHRHVVEDIACDHAAEHAFADADAPRSRAREAAEVVEVLW
jgi:hypothetical protein